MNQTNLVNQELSVSTEQLNEEAYEELISFGVKQKPAEDMARNKDFIRDKMDVLRRKSEDASIRDFNAYAITVYQAYKKTGF
ncbi:MAG: hypothetical protein WCV92_02305 [Candidatus Buchananbacteria bacterium]